MKKLSNTETELKKLLLLKKRVVIYYSSTKQSIIYLSELVNSVLYYFLNLNVYSRAALLFAASAAKVSMVICAFKFFYSEKIKVTCVTLIASTTLTYFKR